MKRPLSNSMRLVIGSIVSGLAAVVVVLIVSQSERPEAPVTQTAAPTATPQGPTPTPTISLETQLGNVDVPEVPEEVIERILKEDKTLGTFMEHYRTVLPDAKKREAYHKLLSDPALMNTMAEALMNPGDGHPEPEEYYRRLMQIDYFEAGLSWKDNPQRDKMLQVTGDIIAKDNFQSGQDTARREILGGTKMELYHLLYEHDAQKAGELVAQAKGTRMEALANWVAQEELRRRAEEKDLQAKIDELSRNE